jgi:hypothetical protein
MNYFLQFGENGWYQKPTSTVKWKLVTIRHENGRIFSLQLHATNYILHFKGDSTSHMEMPTRYIPSYQLSETLVSSQVSSAVLDIVGQFPNNLQIAELRAG